MDEELFARSIASICGALTVLADQNDPNRPKRTKPEDHMGRGLAYSDCWLDNIMRGSVKVDSKGTVTFDSTCRKPRSIPPGE